MESKKNGKGKFEITKAIIPGGIGTVFVYIFFEPLRDLVVEIFKESIIRNTPKSILDLSLLILVKSIIILFFILLESMKTDGFLGRKSLCSKKVNGDEKEGVKEGEKDDKKGEAKEGEKKNYCGLFFVKLVIFAIIAITFITSPFFWDNISSICDDINKTPVTTTIIETVPAIQPPTSPVETTIDPTEPTITPTNTPIPPTDTPSPTPTSQLSKYRVGVLALNDEDCGENNKNDQIIEGLKELGFNAFEVEINDDYSNIDVLYMPYSWSCTANTFDLGKIRNYLDRGNKGLLIGNPDPDSEFTFKLFLFDLKFKPLTDQQIDNQLPPEIRDRENNSINIDLFFDNIDEINYPRAETELSIVQYDINELVISNRQLIPYTFNILLRHNKEYIDKHKRTLGSIWRISFVIIENDKNQGRVIVMPGSEYSSTDYIGTEDAVSKYAVSKEVMKDIIVWLAHGADNN